LSDEYLDGLTAELDRRAAWWERQIAEAANRRWIQIVAHDDIGIVGFVTCGPLEDQTADPWVGEVYAIYVHPRAWSQGVGRQLFVRAAELLRLGGYREAVLWVLETNARARRFYEISGWRADGATKTEHRGAVELREVRYRGTLPSEREAFPRNSYVVLDLPPPVADKVLAIREGHGDFFRGSLVAETTVIGSGGVGPIHTSEDSARVYRIVDEIASSTPPIRARLGPVRRFPNSDVFYFSFVDEAPLIALHARIASSGLRFAPVSFSFVPHVTARTRAPINDAEASDLLALRIADEFILDTLSVYQLVWRQPPTDHFQTLLCLLHRARLVGTN
jgi:GNAT superfamily N-acetyltransferase